MLSQSLFDEECEKQWIDEMEKWLMDQNDAPEINQTAWNWRKQKNNKTTTRRQITKNTQFIQVHIHGKLVA